MAEADRADVILQPVVFVCLHTVTSQRHMNDKFDWTHGSWTAWRFPPLVRLVFQMDLHRLNFINLELQPQHSTDFRGF